MFAKVSTDMFTEYLLLGKKYITQIKVSICIHKCPYILIGTFVIFINLYLVYKTFTITYYLTYTIVSL